MIAAVGQNTYVVAVEGLSALRDLETIPKEIRRNAARAINRTLDRTATRSRKAVQAEVAFKAQYLSGVDSKGKPRLGVSSRASEDNLSGAITAQFRPTMLARFVTSGRPAAGGKRASPITVQVNPGLSRRSRRMFLIRLPAGRGGDLLNMGVAIRLRPGETVQNKKKMTRISGNLYLLHGPSVDQVFRTVAVDEAPEAGDFLEAEFLRLMEAGI